MDDLTTTDDELTVALRDALETTRRDFAEARLRVAAWGLADAETAVTDGRRRCRTCQRDHDRAYHVRARREGRQ